MPIDHLAVTDSDGNVVANITIDDTTHTGKVVITAAGEGSDAYGDFVVSMNVDTSKVTQNETVPVTFGLNANQKSYGNIVYIPGTINSDEMFSKYTYNGTLGKDKSDSSVTNPNYYTPDDITHGNLTYAMRINAKGYAIKSAVVGDQLVTTGFKYDPDSFLAYKTTWTYSNGDWHAGTLTYDSSIKPVIASDGRSFTIDFGNAMADGQGYIVFYRLLGYDATTDTWMPVNKLPVDEQPLNGSIIHNNASLTSSNQNPVNYSQTMQVVSQHTNGGVTTITIQGQKTLKNDTATNRPSSITICLYKDGVDTGETYTTNADKNWTYIFTGLDKYKDGSTNTAAVYTVKEKAVPAGYTETVNGYDIVNTYNNVTTSTVTKVWSDNSNQDGVRPTTITLDLYQNGTLYKTYQLSSSNVSSSNSNEWTYTATNLPTYDKDGNAYTYTWKEESVSGYSSTVNNTTNTITNSHTPETTSATVKKVWSDSDNQDGYRPSSIVMDLYANGVKTGQTVTLDAANNWTGTLSNLAKYKSGSAITYSWQEESFTNSSKYTSSTTTSGDTTTITNSHTPATISKSVTKQWADSDNQDGLRPSSITVNLLANGQVVKTVTLNAANNWTTSLSDLAEYSNGQKITYTWQEANVPAGYTASVDGDTITNSHTPATISKSVTKQWADSDNQDGLRPSSITVNLLANGKVVKTVTLNAANNWTTSLSDLAEYSNGQKITYTWQEANVPTGYTASVDGDTITNSHTPATISKKVTKQWADSDNQDGLRPSSITVNLLANGKVVKTVTLDAANNWTTSVSDLAEYSNGQKITYTWQEANVPAGYTASVDGDTITNSHTPATISKNVTKQWADSDNQDGLRPSSITVNLLANGKVVKTVTLDAANNWTTSVSDLAEYSNGQKITYTWQEANVPAGYTASVDGDTITNSHTPATISKKVTKQWADSDNQDGLRPSSITVNLLANGKVVKTVTLNAANNWMTSVSDLAEYSNGQKITYTWQEANVPAGYTASVDGDTITNSHTPATISKKVTKQWADSDNQDGLRPSSITVNLLANGKVVKTVTLNAANNWTTSLSDLAEYSNGQKITYTWQEANVPAGYTASVDGDTITNSHTPATISKKVTKQWADSDNQDGLRPSSITVNLLANGKVVKTVTLNAANNWTTSLSDLAEYSNGQKITYTWQEANVPAGYTASVDGDTITNSHTPATISKNVTKQWADSDNQDGLRPSSITVNLLANGQVVKTVTLNAANNWTTSVSDLAEYSNGQKITYTWQEANVPAGYTASVDGDTITNSHTPATISKNVTKQWADSDNQDGLRPSSITVNLLANGQVVKTVTLDAANNWTTSLSDLAEYSNGQKITYTWQEANVPTGYTANVDGDTITNSHTPATISKNVTKQWADSDNQDGLRPSSITVNLLANGQVVKTVTLNAANNWTTSLSDLAEYSNGQKITYTWQEANVPAGYTASVDGDTITNSHTPATISKNVTKQWADSDNQDGLRPSSITVNLLANGQVVKTVTLNAANNWTTQISGLAKYSHGQQINYTWEETNVPSGYHVTVNGDTITNTHTPETTVITVHKVWIDKDYEQHRPSSIKVNVLANGQIIHELTLNANNNWITSLANLPVYANGQKIVYSVSEVNVPDGYQSQITNNGNNNFVITNTYVPGKPVQPNQPNTPNKPVQPEQPAQPNKPVQPEQPSQPGKPVQPEQPVQPHQPVQPTQPVTPAQPGQPIEPTLPTQPVQPSKPGQPSQGEKNGEQQLPQTGNQKEQVVALIGLLLFGLTSSMLIVEKKFY